MSDTPLTASKTREFTPAALEQRDPRPIFYLRIPTWEDRDEIGSRMFRMNVREVTTQQMQAMILSEMFEIKDEVAADADARFLEGFWQRQSMYQLDLSVWNEQEAQRLIDEHESGKKFDPAPQPPERSTIRERARAQLLVSELSDRSQRLRDKLADQQAYDKRYAVLVVRLQVVGWKGLKTKAQFEDDVLTPETIERLRSELMDYDNTGGAWQQLRAGIEEMFDLSASAEKNSSSPQESGSPPNGSTSPITGSESTDGSSRSIAMTDEVALSSTDPTPAIASPKTTGTSSGSSNGSASAKPKRGRTVAK